MPLCVKAEEGANHSNGWGEGRSPSYSFGHPGVSWSATTDLLATNKADYRGGTYNHSISSKQTSTQCSIYMLNIHFTGEGASVFFMCINTLHYELIIITEDN